MTNTTRIIVSGIVATTAMTMIMMVAPYMGLPKMDIAGMLSSMTHTPQIVGWLMHFMIGTFFALIYSKYITALLHIIDSNFLRGLTYGLIIFIIAQIMMPILMKIMPPLDVPMPENQNMMLTILGSLIGHLVFGGTLGLFYDKVIVQQPKVG